MPTASRADDLNDRFRREGSSDALVGAWLADPLFGMRAPIASRRDASVSILPPQGGDLGDPLGGRLEGRPVPAIVEVVPPVDQEDRRLAAGQVRRATAGLCRDAHLHLGDAVDQV
jgi:hypothetical protein